MLSTSPSNRLVLSIPTRNLLTKSPLLAMEPEAFTVTMFVLLVVVEELAAVPLITPPAQHLTQRDINAAVQYTLEHPNDGERALKNSA